MASHCESSPGSFDECRLSAKVAANPQTKPTDLDCESAERKAATVHIHHRHHRLRGSASPVLTATGFVNRKGQFSTPHRIDTPQPITKKFVTGDYVGDPYGCAKVGVYPSTGGFWAHG